MIATRIMHTLMLICLTTVLVGCSRYRPPDIAVVDMRSVLITDEALQIDIDFELVNPNREPLELVHVDYRLDVDGRTVFQARRATRATLPSGQIYTATIPAVVPFDRANWIEGMPSSAACSVHGSLMYVTPGALAEVLLDTGVRRPKVGFRGERMIQPATARLVNASTIVPVARSDSEIESNER
ncbi:MAG: hypothetical protein AAF432_03200 [Planctomycetota bacterium]